MKPSAVPISQADHAGDEADPQRERHAGDHHRQQVAALVVGAERVVAMTAADPGRPTAGSALSTSTKNGPTTPTRNSARISSSGPRAAIGLRRQ